MHYSFHELIPGFDGTWTTTGFIASLICLLVLHSTTIALADLDTLSGIESAQPFTEYQC